MTLPTRRAMLSAMAGAGLHLLAGRVRAAAPEEKPRPIALRFGKLVDGTGKVLNDAVVVVEGQLVAEVREKGEVPRGAEVIDLRRYTGIPGLIDAHTHMTYWYDDRSKKSPLKQKDPHPAVAVFMSQENARKTLAAGVTTVRDLTAGDFADIAMRDLINRGAMVGPRMFVSGHGLLLRKKGDTENYKGHAKGVEEVIKVVKEQVDAGADWIKLFGSTGGYQDVSGDQTFSVEEMKAAVETAHKHRKRIAIHSYGRDGVRAATRAGADSIEHGADLDDETLREMAKKKITWVPTIDHNRYYVDNAKLYEFTDKDVKNLRGYIERNLISARCADVLGVTMAMGSDAVYTGFGENTRELSWFVEAGMTPAEALKTATTNGAALLGMEKRLGAVSKGYFADVVAVEGDPLKDIQVVIKKVRWVMKAGKVVVDHTKDR